MSETNIERLKSALNLDREPFSDEGVRGLFFPGGGRQELVEQVIHLCRYGPPLLILLGENGVGKSTVIAQAEERFDPSVFQWVHVEADVLADEHLILQQIEECFHLDLGQDSQIAIQTLIRYARELDGFSQTPLIIVDEAQNLSPSAIEFLQQLLAPAARSGLRCLLSLDGDSVDKIPLLKPLLQGEQEFQALQVAPLGKAAIEAYVDYRMTTSGLSEIRFSGEQMRQIVNQSMGNIDRINIAARQILVAHFPYEKNHRKPRRIPLFHSVGVVVLAALLLLAYSLAPEFSPLDSGQDGAGEIAGNVPANGERYPATEKRVSGATLSAPSGGNDYPSLDDQQGRALEQQQIIADAVVESEPELVPPPERNTRSPEAETVETSLDSFAADGASVDFNYAEQEAPDDPLQPVARSDEKRPPATAEQQPVTRKTPTPVAAAQPEKPPQKSQTTADLSPREQWLMSLDKNKYTLQMLGASEEAAVQKFLARHPSLKEIAYYRTTHRDQDWYVVVYGLFPSKESAKQELTRLPKALQASGPWARSVASVQEEIRKRD